MAAINLAPGTEYLALARKRRRRLYSITVVLAVALIAIWVGLFLFRQQVQGQEQDLDRRIAAMDAEIARLGDEADRIRLFEARLNELDVLIDNHLQWDVLLQELERLLPAPTVLTSAEANVDTKTLTLGGVTPDIDQVAQALASLKDAPTRQTIFSQASLGSIARQEEVNPDTEEVSANYTFGASLTFDVESLRASQ